MIIWSIPLSIYKQKIMKPYNERTPDNQYKNLLRRILKEGVEVDTWQSQLIKKSGGSPEEIRNGKSMRIPGHQMMFDLDNGFPLITERNLGKTVKAAISEHVAFLNGIHTREELAEWGCSWWDRWLTKEKCEIFGLQDGDMGPGAYGPAWTNFPTSEGYSVNQIENVIEQIKREPWSRTHFITNWIPQYVVSGPQNERKVVVAPCHGILHILINTETNEMDIHHFQRSSDSPVGLVFDLIQYAFFGMALEKIVNYKFRKLVYTTSDTHLYLGQIPDVEKLLTEPDRRFPSASIDATGITNITDYRSSHFILGDDYESGESMKIWTPI